MPPPPPRLTLFPYTTLFRSAASSVTRVLRERPGAPGGQVDLALGNRPQVVLRLVEEPAVCLRGLPVVVHDAVPQARARRSEEHTSELQSRVDLVCRLLLYKN